jgi:putative Mn2+ efflux pump MntP
MLIDIFSGHALFGEYVFMLLCCMAAWMIGKSVATDWNGMAHVLGFVLILGFGVRFLHFALYEAQFVSVTRYIVDTALLAVVAYIGYRYTRTNQMTTQYHWLYEKLSPLSFRERG